MPAEMPSFTDNRIGFHVFGDFPGDEHILNLCRAGPDIGDKFQIAFAHLPIIAICTR